MENLGLNESQRKAIRHNTGPMMVLAGPGSGKTTVITYRIKNLIEEYDVRPGDILVITFTKAATVEMSKRFSVISGNVTGVTFATFHSFFFRVIRRHYGYEVGNILKDFERREIVKGIIGKLSLSQGDEEDFLLSVLNEISLVKNEMICPDTYNSTSLGNDEFLAVYRQYEGYKNKAGKIDFDDMLHKCYELITNNPDVAKAWQRRYPHILIDEFQDINRLQYECIKIFAKPEDNIFIVGDDDQSIYRFRGARPEFLLSFPKDFRNSKKVILNVNYRSTDQIIKICNGIIKGNRMRYDKDIIGTNRRGSPLHIMEPEDVSVEAKQIARIIKRNLSDTPLNEIAVLYRVNIQSRAFVDAFMDMNIPYQLKDEMPGLYEHWIAKDICAYLRLSKDRSLNDDLLRIINKPKRYVSKAVLYAAKKHGGNLLNSLYAGNLMQHWQAARIDELIFYLNAIKKRTAVEAVKYIKLGVGYGEYLKEYADFRNTNPSGMYEVMDELTEAAKGYETIDDFLAHVDEVNGQSLSKKKGFGQTDEKGEQKNGVTLSTIHSAKGLEYETVFIASAVEGVIPYERSKTPIEIEEERRLFYVAATRAKKDLYISLVKSRYERETAATRFLSMES